METQSDIMLCKFCNSILKVESVSLFNKEGRCRSCPIPVKFYWNEIPLKLTAIKMYDSSKPKFVLILNIEYSTSILVSLENFETIFSINSILDITPANFNEKLNFYLALI